MPGPSLVEMVARAMLRGDPLERYTAEERVDLLMSAEAAVDATLAEYERATLHCNTALHMRRILEEMRSSLTPRA